jgi:hypothetical protein
MARPTKSPKLTSLLRSLKKKAGKTDLFRSTSVDKFSEAVSLGLSDKITFGKFKNKTVRKVLTEEPMYLVWLTENNTTIRFNKRVMSELEPYLSNVEVVDTIDCDATTEDLY